MRFIIFIFTTIFLLSCVGVKNENNTMEDKTVEEHIKITGRIQIYGSEPHTYVGIVDRNGNEYAVSNRSVEDDLRKLQGHVIEFTVIFRNDQRVYGSLFLKSGTVEPITWVVLQ